MNVKRIILIALAMGITTVQDAQAIGDADAGAELVNSECVRCHSRDISPRSPNNPPSFRDIVQKRGLTRDEMRSFLRKSHYPMPPRAFSTSQIEDLIAHFRSLGYWP